MLQVGKKREEELKRVYSGTSRELFSSASSVPSLHSFSLPFCFFFFLCVFFYFLKGVSLPMLCQKVEVLRLGSANMKTCCWGKAVGREGCFCRRRKS